MSITALYGIYNANGGILGETRYIIGHLLGLTSCSLCDITHSPLRRKPEWDGMVATLGVPFTLLHRNEVDHELSAMILDQTLPLVLGRTNTGELTTVLDANALSQADGSVKSFQTLLQIALLAL
jgi:hypothetical protein